MNTKTKGETVNPFLQMSSNVFGQNRLLKIMMGCMTVGVFMIYGSVNDFKDHQQTVIQPIGRAEPYEIGNYTANNAYLFDMAETIVNLSGNISQKSVKAKFNMLLNLFHDSVHTKYQERLKLLASEVAQFSTISHAAELAYPEPIFVKDNKMRIRVKKSRIVGATVKPPEIRYLLIEYIIENGRFWIMSMNEMSESEYNEAIANED